MSSRSSQPKWRSLSTSKRQQPATSLSLVFAHPEHASPLRSALDQLPLVSADDSSSLMSVTSKKRERFHSTVSRDATREEEDDPDPAKRPRQGEEDSVRTATVDGSLDGSERTHPGPAVLSESPQDVASPISGMAPVPPVPFPSTPASQTLASPDPAASRSSWFGSLSRAKGRAQLSVASSPQAISASDEPPSAQATSDLPPNTASRTRADTTDVVQSTPATPDAPRPTCSPNQVTSMPSTGSISSVDEQVPQRTPSTGNTPPSLSVPVLMQSQSSEGADNPSVSSLNPSTSRFMLRIPLLGRPKMTLDQAVAATTGAQSGVESRTSERQADEAHSAPADHALPMDAVVPTVEIHDATQDEITPPDTPALAEPVATPPVVASISQPTELPPDTSAHAPSASSWWEYVGWSRSAEAIAQESSPSGPIPADPEAEAAPVAEKHVAAPTSAVALSPETLRPSANPVDPTSPPQSTASSDQTARQDTPPTVQEEPTGVQTSDSADGQKPASVLSAQSANTQASAWYSYSPWAWYATSPRSPAPDAFTPDPQQDAPKEVSTGSDAEEAQMTESEMVKEQALAREDPAPAPAPDAAAAEGTATSSNPVETSFATNRSGWVSFFMSRTLVTKAIADEPQRDENGMEVMVIDDEEPEGSAAAAAPVPASPAVAIPQAPGGRQSGPASQASSALPSPKATTALQKREFRRSGAPPPPSSPRDGPKAGGARSPSPAPSKASVGSATPRVPARNLVLPTWDDTFNLPPRSVPPPSKNPKSKLSKTLSFVSRAVFNKDEVAQGKGKGKEKEHEFVHFGKHLPKALDVVGEQLNPYLLNGGCRVVVIGVAGWSPGAVIRTIAGGLPSSSSKFVNMTAQALEQFEQQHGLRFKKVTKMPLDGDGTIERKVHKVYEHLLANEDWMEDLHAADVIFVATHSQGSIISTHLIDRLIRDGHILTSRSVDILTRTAAAIAPGGAPPSTQAQRICFLALCGIHLGPLRYLKTSSLLQPYIQYFENAAARELFEFQNTESHLAKDYIRALRNIMDHGTKVVYIASLNDQVVPIYSGLFTAASHPRILRALYIDGDAYHSSDFLANLLVLLIRIMNSGLSDGGLLAHLSEATAGTLSGVGHSSIYEEPATFSLAVNYFFLSSDGEGENAELAVEPFDAVVEQNDYEIPWSLRDMIADERVAHFFASEFAQLRDAFDDWQPKTSILRDVKRKLQPIQRLSSFTSSSTHNTVSKL